MTVLVRWLPVSLLGLCFGLVGCGQAQTAQQTSVPALATVPAKHSPLPQPGATQQSTLPRPVSSAQPHPTISLPQAIASRVAEATAGPLRATAEVAARVTATTLAAPILQRDYGAWSAVVAWEQPTPSAANREPVYGYIRYDDNSVAGLTAYVRANQALAPQLAQQGGDAEVRITFRTYLSPDQFTTWAAQAGLQIKNLQLGVLYEPDPQFPTPVPCPQCRGGGGGGLMRVDNWIDLMAQLGDTAPQLKTRIDKAVALREQDVRAQGYKLQKLQGVCFTTATVPARQLPALANDPQVFLAEVTGEFLRRQVRATGRTEPVRMIYGLASNSWSHNSFPQIEKLGLGNLTK